MSARQSSTQYSPGGRNVIMKSPPKKRGVAFQKTPPKHRAVTKHKFPTKKTRIPSKLYTQQTIHSRVAQRQQKRFAFCDQKFKNLQEATSHLKKLEEDVNNLTDAMYDYFDRLYKNNENFKKYLKFHKIHPHKLGFNLATQVLLSDIKNYMDAEDKKEFDKIIKYLRFYTQEIGETSYCVHRLKSQRPKKIQKTQKKGSSPRGWAY